MRASTREEAAVREEAALLEEASISAELRRIDFTGTFWFAAALIGTAIVLSGLLSTGWRPADLPLPGEVLWWISSGLGVLGMAGLAWAGCPVFAFTPEVADRQKAFTIRVGLIVFSVGSALSTIVILLSPAGPSS